MPNEISFAATSVSFSKGALPFSEKSYRVNVSEGKRLKKDSLVLENESSRFVIIVTFLALLEMWKHERISVKQEALLGPILLERGPRWQEEIIEDEIDQF